VVRVSTVGLADSLALGKTLTRAQKFESCSGPRAGLEPGNNLVYSSKPHYLLGFLEEPLTRLLQVRVLPGEGAMTERTTDIMLDVEFGVGDRSVR